MLHRAMAALSLAAAAIYPTGAFHGLVDPERQPCLGGRLVDAMDAQGLHKPLVFLAILFHFPAAGVPFAET